MVRGAGAAERGARALGTVRWTRYSGPCTWATLSGTCGLQGVVLTSCPGLPACRTRRLPLVTTAPKAWLAWVRFFSARTLGMDARLTMCITRYTQERQFVETDIQAWILGSKVARLPHCSQKHASGGLIVATIVRCLTGLLICLPRRLGRECPDHAPSHTR
jgi:hypothetical protein